MFQYCPSCASKNIRFDGRTFRCPDCAFVYYHNIATAATCIVHTDSGVLLLVRGKEPSAGKLGFPGGFVDNGEGALQALHRELMEEIGWQPPVPPATSLAEVYTLFASFPNIYPYKNIVYNTCDLFFSLRAPGLTESDLRLQAGEVSGARFVPLNEINPDDLAFDSFRHAIQAFRDFLGKAK